MVDQLENPIRQEVLVYTYQFLTSPDEKIIDIVSPFHFFVTQSKLEDATLCMKQGIDLKSTVDYQERPGANVLHFAAGSGDTEMVELLLSKSGALSINVNDKQGWTPLVYAARYGHLQVCKKLV